MKREEFIEKWGWDPGDSREELSSDLDSVIKDALPPAEGAEEILKSVFIEIWGEIVPPDIFENSDYTMSFADAKIVAERFATLHAQRIAEKMMEENKSDKYVLTYEELKDLACTFFRSWWNTPGSNTEQGFDAWALKTGLKK